MTSYQYLAIALLFTYHHANRNAPDQKLFQGVGAQALPGSSCPGVAGGVCTGPCQEATCNALLAFFKSTYNDTSTAAVSWTNREGWERLSTASCTQILAQQAPAGMPPAYCTWFGVTCCFTSMKALGFCSTLFAVKSLTVQINGLHGSINSPLLEQSVMTLHDCGLADLQLEGNFLSGSLTDFWGQLSNLKFLNLGRSCGTGRQ